MKYVQTFAIENQTRKPGARRARRGAMVLGAALLAVSATTALAEPAPTRTASIAGEVLPAGRDRIVITASHVPAPAQVRTPLRAIPQGRSQLSGDAAWAERASSVLETSALVTGLTGFAGSPDAMVAAGFVSAYGWLAPASFRADGDGAAYAEAYLRARP